MIVVLPVEKYGAFSVVRKNIAKGVEPPAYLSPAVGDEVRRFHRSLSSYAPTPLISLASAAEKWGIKAFCVKDESFRFGLKAFKGLGGSYAVFCKVCGELGLEPRTATMADLKGEAHREKVSQMVFATATDGNHGKGIAWAAAELGCASHVYMPKGSAEVRAEAIREMGKAEVVITELSYDDTVRYAAALAEKNGWYLMQDTGKEEQDEVPRRIVQGYLTMVDEALEQMEALGYDRPTHVLLQAGVGSMAGSVAGALACRYPTEKPMLLVVEPDEVACIFESMRQNDGKPHPAVGNETTMMAGLNCAEPCEGVWPVLRDFCECGITCPDRVSAYGMRLLAHPIGGDSPVISGESGAVTTGVAAMLLTDPACAELKKKLCLDDSSVILVFNTEGDTDPENYKRIVDGDMEECSC